MRIACQLSLPETAFGGRRGLSGSGVILGFEEAEALGHVP
jgi:hypothetical protein